MESIKRITPLFFSLLFLTFPLNAEEVPLAKVGGVYEIPVEINGILTLHFMIDTGAAEVMIPADVFLTLTRTGTIKNHDYLPGKSYTLADGSTIKSPRFILRKMKIGKKVFYNISASIGNIKGTPLIGQSLLERIGNYAIDTRRRVFIFGPKIDTASSYKRITADVSEEMTEPYLPTPTEAVKVFVESVTKNNFRRSWLCLTSFSQNQLVQFVAEKQNYKGESVRGMFEYNAPEVQKVFWNPFRENFSLTDTTSRSYKIIKKKRGIATVKVTGGLKDLIIKAYRGGLWKVGLVESFEAVPKLDK